MPASPSKRKPPRKQVNIGFDPADYERIQVAAVEAELTPTEYIRDAVLLSLEPPEPVDVQSVGFLTWLMAILGSRRERVA